MRAFADTSYFVALLNSRDALFGRASEFARTPMFITTTEYVLVEVAGFFCRVGARTLFSRSLRKFSRAARLSSCPLRRVCLRKGSGTSPNAPTRNGR